MIGISELDNLSTESIESIIRGEIKILVKDPRKIQTCISKIEKPKLIDSHSQFMDNDTVITLLKMEIETRLGWAYVRKELEMKI